MSVIYALQSISSIFMLSEIVVCREPRPTNNEATISRGISETASVSNSNPLQVKMRRTKRRQILISLGLVMFMGIAVYFRLWTIDYRISANDTELLRRQFDLANREAMDESAEWRRRYDSELEKTAKCYRELEEIKKSRGETTKVSVVLNKKMEMLQQENMDLLQRVKTLKQELEVEKLKCSMRNL